MTITYSLSTPNTYYLFREDKVQVVIYYSKEEKKYITSRITTDEEDCAIFNYIRTLNL